MFQYHSKKLHNFPLLLHGSTLPLLQLDFLFLGLKCLFAIKYTLWLIIHYLFSIIHSNAVFSIRNDEKLSIFPLENITWPYLNS